MKHRNNQHKKTKKITPPSKAIEAEAPYDKVIEGAKKAVEHYIDDLILLGSE